AQCFQQRKDAPPTALLLVRAEELQNWGGAPQKSSRFMKGFQRSEEEAHWREIAEFLEMPGNISPTAVVVAFKPNSVKILAENGDRFAPPPTGVAYVQNVTL